MPAGAAGGGEFIRVEADPKQLAHILAGAKAFSPKLATNLRREMRKAGDSAINDMRGILGSGPVGGAIGQGIRLQVQTSKTKQGIRITSTGAGLSADKKPLTKAFNLGTFRHPVYGNRNAWVNQAGRPYFGVVLKHRDEILAAVDKALNDAVEAIK
jgi:hypothetical protein